jgi:hypothetical protein
MGSAPNIRRLSYSESGRVASCSRGLDEVIQVADDSIFKRAQRKKHLHQTSALTHEMERLIAQLFEQRWRRISLHGLMVEGSIARSEKKKIRNFSRIVLEI